MNLKKLITELKRRNVFKVAMAYAIAGWLIIQVATSVFPAFKFPAWTTQFVIILVLIGFPIAVILAWAFEMTPEGVKRTDDVPVAESMTKKTGRKLDIILGIFLALAVGIIFYQFLNEPNKAITDESFSRKSSTGNMRVSQKSIAVLPFVNDSGNSSEQYFSDGLSEDLIIALSQYPKLKVIGRESSFHFRGSDLDGKTIGKKLGVAHLLEGSVSREGGEVRIRTELVNTNDGSTLWSEHYDRPYKDLFVLQDKITHAVATALKAKLLTDSSRTAVVQTDRPPSGSLEAYNNYHEGNFYYDQLTLAGYQKAINYYKQAIQIDPKYVAAYAALSNAWASLGGEFLSGQSMLNAFKKGKMFAEKALKIDSSSSVAHSALGTIFLNTMKWKKSEAEDRRALQLAPGNALAQKRMAKVLATQGQLKEAVKLLSKAQRINPLDAKSYAELAAYLTCLHRFHDAKSAIRKAIALQPTAHDLHAVYVMIKSTSEDTASLLQVANRETNVGWRQLALCWAYTTLNKKNMADSVLHKVITNYSNIAAFQIAESYALLKQPAQAFAWLNRAWKQHDPGIGMLLNDPILLHYKKDQRFAMFCRKVGLPVPGNTHNAS